MLSFSIYPQPVEDLSINSFHATQLDHKGNYSNLTHQSQENYIYIRVLDAQGNEIDFRDSASFVFPYKDCDGKNNVQPQWRNTELYKKQGLTFVKVKLPVECLAIVHNGELMVLAFYCLDKKGETSYEMDELAFIPHDYPYTISICSNKEWGKGLLNLKDITPPKLRKAELPNIPVRLIPYRKGDQWGFCKKDKTLIIQPEYDNAWPFKNGLAKVEKDGKQGYINKRNKVVIPFKYESCSQKGDFIIVYKQSKFGVIDLQGKEVIQLIYDGIHRLEDHSFVVTKDKKSGLFNIKKFLFITNLNLTIPIEFNDIYETNLSDIVRVKKDGKWGLFTVEGQQLTPLKYENEPVHKLQFTEGLAPISVNNKWGFVDEKGEEIISPQFDEVHPFHNGLARIRRDSINGFIDKSGELVVSSKYYILSDFHEGMAQVATKEDHGMFLLTQIGYMNKKGAIIIPLKYRGATDFYQGKAAVNFDVDRKNKWVLIDREGNVVDEFDDYRLYGQLVYIGNDSFMPNQDYYNVGYARGVLVPGPENRILPYNDLHAVVNVPGHSESKLVNNQLERLGEFNDQWLAFQNGTLSVKKRKWGCVDTSGNTVIEFKYDQPVLFNNGLARITLDGKQGYITLDGEEYFD